MYILYIVFFLACIPTLYGKCLSKMCLIWITSYIDFGTLYMFENAKRQRGIKTLNIPEKLVLGYCEKPCFSNCYWSPIFISILIHNNSIWLWELSVVSGTDNILQNSMLFYGWIQLLANILKLTLKSTYKIHLYIV